jgi:hypothetical protein
VRNFAEHKWGISMSAIKRTSLIDIRAAELTADRLGRTVKIDPGDPTVIVGRLVSIRHREGKAAPSETETQVEVEVTGDQRIRMGLTASSGLRGIPAVFHAMGSCPTESLPES